MKKNLLLLVAIIFIQYSSNAQSCDGRYQTPIFAIQIDSNIVYGANADLAGDTTQLKMDIYQPIGDTLSQRPVITFAHGGYFIGGDKKKTVMWLDLLHTLLHSVMFAFPIITGWLHLPPSTRFPNLLL
jgi:acetyl esterase/lipase